MLFISSRSTDNLHHSVHRASSFCRWINGTEAGGMLSPLPAWPGHPVVRIEMSCLLFAASLLDPSWTALHEGLFGCSALITQPPESIPASVLYAFPRVLPLPLPLPFESSKHLTIMSSYWINSAWLLLWRVKSLPWYLPTLTQHRECVHSSASDGQDCHSALAFVRHRTLPSLSTCQYKGTPTVPLDGRRWINLHTRQTSCRPQPRYRRLRGWAGNIGQRHLRLVVGISVVPSLSPWTAREDVLMSSFLQRLISSSDSKAYLSSAQSPCRSCPFVRLRRPCTD